MNKLSSLLIAGLLLTRFASAQQSDVMLQGFDAVSYQNSAGWYNVLATKAADLKAAGFNTVWLPPPSDNTGGMGYLPRQYYNLNTSHGSQAQLGSLITALHGQGIKVLADVVVNHRVGTTNWADFTNPTWGNWAVCNTDEWKYNGGNPTGANDTGEDFNGGRDLDHTNVTVQNDIKAYLNWLKGTIGFDGWRYDLVKGFSAYYVGIYNDASTPYFSVGEYYDGNRQLVQNWVDGTSQKSAAFDFPLKFTLGGAVGNNDYSSLNASGNEPGLAGWSPSKAVTFLDNHDTYQGSGFPSANGKILQGYAYILTHPGIPMVFWDHYSDWGVTVSDGIKSLIAIRKANGISATSSLSIQAAQLGLYAAIVNTNVAVKLGSNSWSPGTGWYLKASGTDWAVWDKIAPCTTPTLTFTPAGPASGAAPFAVTANATATTGTPTIYYTVDGTTPTTSSTSAVGTKGWSLASTTTVKAFAQISNCGTAVSSNTYTVTAPPPSAGFSVFFNKPAAWGAPKVYYWNTVGGSLPAAVWPGEAMTAYSGNWYKFTFKGVNSSSIIFTDGTNQTADLTHSVTANYSGTTWTDNRPAITYTMDGALDGSATKVADANGLQLYADYNGQKLYIAAKSASGTVYDVFAFVASSLGAGTNAPWAKVGQLPIGCQFLANESTNNYAGWGGGTTTTVGVSTTFVEGTIDVPANFAGASSLYLAVAKYATADGGALAAQAPTAVTANGNIEANEFWQLILSAF